MTVASGNIGFMLIFAGVPWRRGVKRQWGNQKRRFTGLSDATFGTLGNEAKAIIYSIIEALVAIPLTPKYMTLNDCE